MVEVFSGNRSNCLKDRGLASVFILSEVAVDELANTGSLLLPNVAGCQRHQTLDLLCNIVDFDLNRRQLFGRTDAEHPAHRIGPVEHRERETFALELFIEERFAVDTDRMASIVGIPTRRQMPRLDNAALVGLHDTPTIVAD